MCLHVSVESCDRTGLDSYRDTGLSIPGSICVGLDRALSPEEREREREREGFNSTLIGLEGLSGERIIFVISRAD